MHGLDVIEGRVADSYLIYGAGTMGLMLGQLIRNAALFREMRLSRRAPWRSQPCHGVTRKLPVVPETNVSGTISSRWLISFLSADRPRLARLQLSVRTR